MGGAAFVLSTVVMIASLMSRPVPVAVECRRGGVIAGGGLALVPVVARVPAAGKVTAGK